MEPRKARKTRNFTEMRSVLIGEGECLEHQTRRQGASVPLGGGTFGGVDGGLEKYLEAFDGDACMAVEAFEYGCRVAVEEVEVGKVDRNGPTRVVVQFRRDALKKKSVVDEHVALDLQVGPTVRFALSDLCRHLELLSRKTRRKAKRFLWRSAVFYAAVT